MSYSQKPYPNNEDEFPAPPLWLVWRHVDYYYNNKPRPPYKEGQIRHMESLAKAKKSVSAYGPTFYSDWAIYRWEGDRYVLQYDGKAGEIKKDNPLFQRRLTKGAGAAPAREVRDEDLNAAIQSIMEVANG